MLKYRAHIKLFVAVMLTTVTLFAGPVFAQSQATRPDSQQKDVASEVQTLKTENAVVRELLRKMEAQHQALREQLDRLQQRLDGVTTAVVQPSGQSQVADAGQPLANEANSPVPATTAGSASAPQTAIANQKKEDRYQDGIVIWQTPEDAKVPLLMRFNVNTQVRYLNTLDQRRHLHRPSGRCPRGP